MPSSSFKDMVRDAITDEIGAVAMYATMANMVPFSAVALKTLILSIAGDEYGHAKTWLAIYLLDD